MHALDKATKSSDKTKATNALKEANRLYYAWLERLEKFRILDPACGSGNFLYLGLQALKDIEHRAGLEAEALGFERNLIPHTGPHNVQGIELDEYAAELARVTVWIGEIQWMKRHGYEPSRNPILKTLNQIECRDALLSVEEKTAETVAAQWPQADCIIGNPPFLGDKKMRAELGDAYTETLRSAYAGRVPGGADLVCYWFDKARAQIDINHALRAGLVATQAIRAGANRKVLEAIVKHQVIFNAWSDEPWVNEGASVRVSLICLTSKNGSGSGLQADDALKFAPRLNDRPVACINSDLSSGNTLNLTQAKLLAENQGIAFQGPVKVGSFDVVGDVARGWLSSPNPHNKPNRDVLRPWANGQDVTSRPSDTWIIDFGASMTESEAALYETPFQHVKTHVKPMRDAGNREGRKRHWWLHGETVPNLRMQMSTLHRYIGTSSVSKHRFFVWLPVAVWPDSRLYAIARDDDATFGILHARMHQVWSLAQSSVHGDGDDGGRPTYNAKSCFETFPFPKELDPAKTVGTSYSLEKYPLKLPHNFPKLPKPRQAIALSIAEAAYELNKLREAWLNPPEWVDVTPEVVPGYPDRIIPKPEYEKAIKERTLTKLYNQRPAWLAHAHEALDAAVANAYGWDDYTSAMRDDEILARLLNLNLERASTAKSDDES